MDERDVTCGELLLEENITTGKIDQNKVYLKRAQRKEGASPERGLLMHHSLDFEENLLKQFHSIDFVNRENVIAALLMFLSAQEENVSDRQSNRGLNQ